MNGYHYSANSVEEDGELDKRDMSIGESAVLSSGGRLMVILSVLGSLYRHPNHEGRLLK